jgi:hypothetical protein
MNPRALPAPPESCGVLVRKLRKKTLRSGTPGFEFPNSLIGREPFNSSLFGNSNSLFCCLAPRKTAASNAKLPRVIPMICSKIQNFLRQKNSLVSNLDSTKFPEGLGASSPFVLRFPEDLSSSFAPRPS